MGPKPRIHDDLLAICISEITTHLAHGVSKHQLQSPRANGLTWASLKHLLEIAELKDLRKDDKGGEEGQGLEIGRCFSRLR